MKNVAFSIYFALADLDKCIEILTTSGRHAEAAMFAKTYCPSKVSELTRTWKEDLVRNHFAVTAEKIANPMDYLGEDSFSDLNTLLKVILVRISSFLY